MAYIEASGAKPKLFEHIVRETWKETMGSTIADKTESVNLHGRVCYITVSSSPLRAELGYVREKIKTKFNEALKEPYVEEVVIR